MTSQANQLCGCSIGYSLTGGASLSSPQLCASSSRVGHRSLFVGASSLEIMDREARLNGALR